MGESKMKACLVTFYPYCRVPAEGMGNIGKVFREKGLHQWLPIVNTELHASLNVSSVCCVLCTY